MSIGASTAIALGVAAGSSVAGVASAKIGSNAANRAGELQARSADAALAFEKERDARDYAQYQKEYEQQLGFAQDDRRFRNEGRAIDVARFNAREGRMTPYRNFGEQGLATLGPLLKPGPAGTSPLAPRR